MSWVFFFVMRRIRNNRTYLILRTINSKLSTLSDHINHGIFINKLQLCLINYFAITVIVNLTSNIFSPWRIPSHGKNCRPEILRREISQTLGTSRSSKAMPKTQRHSPLLSTVYTVPCALSYAMTWSITYGSPVMLMESTIWNY